MQHYLQVTIICYLACSRPVEELSLQQYAVRHINATYKRHISLVSHQSWGWDIVSNSTDLFQDRYQ